MANSDAELGKKSGFRRRGQALKSAVSAAKEQRKYLILKYVT
jgi:hypothetical protein